MKDLAASRRAAGPDPSAASWPDDIQVMLAEIATIEVEIAVATDRCAREHIAGLRARRRQLLGQIELAKARALAELEPA